MSKKYIAKMNNIFFKGKRYNVGDPVLVDDEEKMNVGRWETEEEFNARNEKIAKTTSGLTEKESAAKIKDLTAKLEEAEKKIAEAKDKIADLEGTIEKMKKDSAKKDSKDAKSKQEKEPEQGNNPAQTQDGADNK